MAAQLWSTAISWLIWLVVSQHLAGSVPKAHHGCSGWYSSETVAACLMAVCAAVFCLYKRGWEQKVSDIGPLPGSSRQDDSNHRQTTSSQYFMRFLRIKKARLLKLVEAGFLPLMIDGYYHGCDTKPSLNGGPIMAVKGPRLVAILIMAENVAFDLKWLVIVTEKKDARLPDRLPAIRRLVGFSRQMTCNTG